MVFSSMIFLSVFMPLVIGAHTILKGTKARNILLLAASLVFYAYGEPVYVFLMIGTAFLCYICALRCENTGSKISGGRGRRWMILAVFVCLGALASLKYLNPLCGWISERTGLANPFASLTMPIGVSFFTFQELSYVIDVWRGKTKAERSFARLLLYVCLFPQLIAGPIVLYDTVADQLHDRKVQAQLMAHGLLRFSYGLAKKVLIANSLAVAADECYSAAPSTAVAWLGAVTYMLQIYFDFSGYSDMAIGLGEMLGFRFNENFCWPYAASSMSDFWRRWHISLSAWFREYVYIPLGGNRKGKGRTFLNKMIVFALTGLWHGANITFLLWGIFNGLLVSIEGAARTGSCKKTAAAGHVRKAVGHIYTIFMCLIGFVLFRCDTLTDAAVRIRAMFSPSLANAAGNSLALSQLRPLAVMAIIAGAAACVPFPYACSLRERDEMAPWEAVVCVLLLTVCMLRVASGSYNPFIYFRF